MTAGQQLQFDWSGPGINDNQPAAAVSAEQSARPDVPAGTSTPVVHHAERELHQSPVPWGRGYDPGHPWHYLRAGDNAAPVPFDAIPPAEVYGDSIEHDLPKPAARRIAKAREILTSERRDLEEARLRYEDVIARGAEALSRYDREIAYGGNDEMARAGTLALLFNQIAWRRGRLDYLERLESRQAARRR